MSHVLIRSNDRVSGNSSKFSIKLKIALHGRYVLTNISLANTIYNVGSVNNTIVFNDTINKTVSLTPGSYSASELITEIDSQLNTASSGFTTTFNGDTARITIARTSNFALLFSQGSAWGVLGYEQSDTLQAGAHTGTNIVDLSYPRSIQIKISQSSEINITTDRNRYPSMYLPVSSGFGTIISTKDLNFDNYVMFQDPVKMIDVSIADIDNNDVNLNGSEYEMLFTKII